MLGGPREDWAFMAVALMDRMLAPYLAAERISKEANEKINWMMSI